MADQVDYAYVGDIVKTERDEAGNLMVFGKATGVDMDLDEQVADPEWLKEAMPDWAKWGNLREMHQPIVAGIGRETTSDDSGNWFLKSEVVDAGTAKKIEAGALKGYSIGIKNARVVKDSKAPGGRIVGGTIVEVSYVDRPCYPTSTIGIAKAVGADNILSAVEAAPGTAWLKKKASTVVSDKKIVPPEGADEKPPVPDGYKLCSQCQGSGRTNKGADMDLEKRIEKLEKRVQKSGKNIDSSGRDVSDLDSGDFAGPNGTFPIKTRDDVSDAASLAHHADNPAAVRAKIRAIAKRKFQMKNEDLPPSIQKSKKAKASKAADADVKKLVKKAVKSETAELVARAEAAEAKLEQISKTVVPGGPRPMGFPVSASAEARAELKARVEKYKRLANEAQDTSLQRGYAELAKKVEADIAKMA